MPPRRCATRYRCHAVAVSGAAFLMPATTRCAAAPTRGRDAPARQRARARQRAEGKRSTVPQRTVLFDSATASLSSARCFCRRAAAAQRSLICCLPMHAVASSHASLPRDMARRYRSRLTQAPSSRVAAVYRPRRRRAPPPVVCRHDFPAPCAHGALRRERAHDVVFQFTRGVRVATLRPPYAAHTAMPVAGASMRVYASVILRRASGAARSERCRGA